MNSIMSQTFKREITVHNSISSIRAMRRALPSSKTVGFVPTMGALHDGHLSLVREAREKNDILVASVFVNPTQFGKGEDLDKYPRQLEMDCDLLADLDVDHVFAPNPDIMYGQNHVTFVEPLGFNDMPEGFSRPEHFRGVATVVTKLFNIIQPTRAYFGQKDAAQCSLIRRIVDDLNIPVEVVVMNTVREKDGLAMSSRNVHLSDRERAAAPVLYSSLRKAEELWAKVVLIGDAKTTRDVLAEELVEVVRSILERETLIQSIEYISVDDRETMRGLSEVGPGGAVISIACTMGSVRLIDNIVF